MPFEEPLCLFFALGFLAVAWNTFVLSWHVMGLLALTESAASACGGFRDYMLARCIACLAFWLPAALFAVCLAESRRIWVVWAAVLYLLVFCFGDGIMVPRSLLDTQCSKGLSGGTGFNLLGITGAVTMAGGFLSLLFVLFWLVARRSAGGASYIKANSAASAEK